MYRMVNRGGKGVKTMQVITDKTGARSPSRRVKDGDHLTIINRSGSPSGSPWRTCGFGRATQGVRLIDLRKNDLIAAVRWTGLNEEVRDDLPGEGRDRREWHPMLRTPVRKHEPERATQRDEDDLTTPFAADCWPPRPRTPTW